MALNRLTALPYELELRYTIDAALYYWDELKAAADKCLSMEEKWQREREIATNDWNAKLREQARVFDCLDGFLSAWARVSLLFFPTGSGTFTQERGATLRRLFKIDESSPINSRALRNAWMHHDERLDVLVSQGRRGSGQRFLRAKDVTDQLRHECLRVIEIDTLVIHYQDQAGTPQKVDLHALRDALRELEQRQSTAFNQLEMPEDEDAT